MVPEQRLGKEEILKRIRAIYGLPDEPGQTTERLQSSGANPGEEDFPNSVPRVWTPKVHLLGSNEVAKTTNLSGNLSLSKEGKKTRPKPEGRINPKINLKRLFFRDQASKWLKTKANLKNEPEKSPESGSSY